MERMASVELSDDSEQDITEPLILDRTVSTNNVLEFQFKFGENHSPTEVPKAPSLKKKPTISFVR